MKEYFGMKIQTWLVFRRDVLGLQKCRILFSFNMQSVYVKVKNGKKISDSIVLHGFNITASKKYRKTQSILSRLALQSRLALTWCIWSHYIIFQIKEDEHLWDLLTLWGSCNIGPLTKRSWFGRTGTDCAKYFDILLMRNSHDMTAELIHNQTVTSVLWCS